MWTSNDTKHVEQVWSALQCKSLHEIQAGIKMIEERQRGDVLEHHHDNYDYWHPVTRVHKMEDGETVPLPDGHILAPVMPDVEEKPAPRGLQVKPFDWVAWDAGCHAKGICQGYHSIPVQVYVPQDGSDPEPGKGVVQQLHHRSVAPDLQGIAKQYWQCPHCKQLQKPIQWAQDARLETYHIATRGHRTILWLKVSSGAWFVLVIKAYGSVQAVASGSDCGTAYYCGIPGITEGKKPQQMPDEIAVALARRFWHKITRGYWSDTPKEDE
jgi:hypothetical protein